MISWNCSVDSKLSYRYYLSCLSVGKQRSREGHKGCTAIHCNSLPLRSLWVWVMAVRLLEKNDIGKAGGCLQLTKGDQIPTITKKGIIICQLWCIPESYVETLILFMVSLMDMALVESEGKKVDLGWGKLAIRPKLIWETQQDWPPYSDSSPQANLNLGNLM